MKPVRGSSRASSEAPKRKTASKSTKHTQKKTVDSQDGDVRDGDGQKDPQKEGEASAGVPGNRPGNLQPISSSSIIALDHMMDWSILATLPLTRRVKEETQHHLNIMKKRFLSHCSGLRAPASKRKNWDSVSQQHQEASKKREIRRKDLSSVDNSLLTVVNTLESIEEKSEALKHACSVLREKVEEEEAKAKEMLQIKDHTVLNLACLPVRHDHRSLEARLRGPMPEGDAEVTAQKLGEILQKSSAVIKTQALLTHAHERADDLLGCSERHETQT